MKFLLICTVFTKWIIQDCLRRWTPLVTIGRRESDAEGRGLATRVSLWRPCRPAIRKQEAITISSIFTTHSPPPSLLFMSSSSLLLCYLSPSETQAYTSICSILSVSFRCPPFLRGFTHCLIGLNQLWQCWPPSHTPCLQGRPHYETITPLIDS